MPPMPADAEAPADLVTPSTSSAAASAARASSSSRVTDGNAGSSRSRSGISTRQQVRVREPGVLVLRRRPSHRHGALGQRGDRIVGKIVAGHHGLPAARPGPAGRNRRFPIARSPRPRRRGPRSTAPSSAPRPRRRRRRRRGARPPPDARRARSGPIDRAGRIVRTRRPFRPRGGQWQGRGTRREERLDAADTSPGRSVSIAKRAGRGSQAARDPFAGTPSAIRPSRFSDLQPRAFQGGRVPQNEKFLDRRKLPSIMSRGGGPRYGRLTEHLSAISPPALACSRHNRAKVPGGRRA